MEQTALTTLESFRLPALGGQAANYDPEEFADIALDFPQVKIPSGGQLSFELPNGLRVTPKSGLCFSMVASLCFGLPKTACYPSRWLKRHFICALILLKLACVMPK